ncbi:MAG: amidophosphoribosyltransferase [Candidatus Hydrogenedens sp.]|jgi:amidophosphoribosyltransferase|nr:amidophosphoribosyltransferase [Candidatus Hydrogenedens sp.]
MGGFFAVTSDKDCVFDLFYGTDYHSHLGTSRGGLAVYDGNDFRRHIHDISNTPFRTKFERDIMTMSGNSGIGVISDMEPQPLIISSHLGRYAIATVSRVCNLDALVQDAFNRRVAHFSETGSDGINPTELIATLINEKTSFAEGITYAQERIEGSCSILLLTNNCIYVARDRYGRTPIITARKKGTMAATFETAVFPNMDYKDEYFLGPGEIMRITPEGAEQLRPPNAYKQVCAFLWVYYGFPASTYENINVEACRYRCGEALAARDSVEADMTAGIPESGSGHAIGYANVKTIPFGRPFTKYTTTWPRSFLPQGQTMRKLMARMKLIPVPALVQNKRLLFCDDSIVRGTQLADTIKRLYEAGAREVHMRPACPPLLYGCKYLNFSRSKSEMDLIARRTLRELEGGNDTNMEEYINPESEKYKAMVDRIRQRLCLTTLTYQRLDDLIAAIGLPKEDLCTYCWDGCEGHCGKQMTFDNGHREKEK